MKNFKKCLILVAIIFIVIIYSAYYFIKSKESVAMIVEDDIYLEKFEKEVVEDNLIKLHIVGEINNPGVVEIVQGARIIDVIEAAGGLKENANISKINLAYVVSDGQKIYIPNNDEKENEYYITDKAGENVIMDDINKNVRLVNINIASQEELETINGIGPATAQKIIEYRKENGKFKKIEDIKNVPGIGDSKFNLIKNNICV